MSWLHVVLYAPEIPGNTGNIIRLCANVGAQLHLVQPLGFVLDDKRLRRAGLDYHEFVNVQVHPDWDILRKATPEVRNERVFLTTKHASRPPTEVQFQPGDMLVMGSETRGLPPDFREKHPAQQRLRLPMIAGSRSLNLANATAVFVYEAWRQCAFVGAMQ
jgi:tRNA (cytidine/uridine-2'-O-)-methyltransferase